MPGLAHKSDRLSNATSSYHSVSTTNGSVSSIGFWSKHSDDISYNQLQKFWSELPPHARQELLRIDKQTLFEQARKNLYCSRCNGLLLEGFLQVVMYGKSMHQDKTNGQLLCNKSRGPKDQMIDGSSKNLASQDEAPDPSVHPWGGLTTTRDGALTLLDCYLYAKSLKGLQNVFDSARARERERELLYPDACGGGGRGWISQGMVGYGRGHGARETCALHTARLSCDTLVDFWSALGEETRQSLLRMKEEDFIERLMYRFDSKRFCRDCRRNVIREFKELKELKRMKKEPRCTTWFCVADTAFQYEVSNNTIFADWHQAFNSVGMYHHFEWAVGTAEGKADILKFENVGMKGSAQANGLDLDGFSACYITLRAWKSEEHYTEVSVKAHALKGQQCVHCRLMVGDGYVTISHGESIRTFFEHAEEAEEEEDDDSVDRDGNDLDGECSRPQKHAKSPELAREFLLDAATVIFKEQVEKAFREGTARQNAHSIFVCLSLKLLEGRVHVACKEIITLQKQMKLLEEEEKEKREEEERKERKRTKEREKKLRRKERLRGKDKEKKCADSDLSSALPDEDEVSSPSMDEDVGNTIEDPATANNTLSSPPDHRGEWIGTDDTTSNVPNNNFDIPDVEHVMSKDECDFTGEKAKFSRNKTKLHRDFQLDSCEKRPERRRSLESSSVGNRSESRYCNVNSLCSSRGTGDRNRQPRASPANINLRNSNPRFNQKSQCSTDRIVDQTALSSCGCNQLNDYRTKVEPCAIGNRMNRDSRSVNKIEYSDLSKPAYRSSKLNQSDYTMHDTCGRSRSSKTTSAYPFGRELVHTKKVWEPIEPQKRYPRSSSDTDVTMRSSTCSIIEGSNSVKSGDGICSGGSSEKLVGTVNVGKRLDETQNPCNSKEVVHDGNGLHVTRSCKSNGSPNFSASSSSSSDNCSSCLSEGDSNAGSSHQPVMESSSSSDSEDGCQLSEAGRDTSTHIRKFSESHCSNTQTEEVQATAAMCKAASNTSSAVILTDNSRDHPQSSFSKTSSNDLVNGKVGGNAGSLNQILLPQVHLHQNNIQYPACQAPTAIGYHHQNLPSWSTGHANGFVYTHPPGHYLFPNPFSYGLNGGESPFCMQYGAVQQIAPPMLNPTHVPVYQPVLHPSGSQFFDQTSVFIARNGAVESSRGEGWRENENPPGHQSPKEVPPVDGAVAGTNGFSLFKFGGPLALSAYKPSSNSSNEGVCEHHYSSVVSSGIFDAENTCCDKKDAHIEEYNLFAASKGIEFSIF